MLIPGKRKRPSMKNYAKCHIEDNEGRILLLKRADSDEHGGMWESAGGGIDEGENTIDAVKREVKEETGLDIEVEHQHNVVFSDDANPEKRYQAHLFKATTFSGEIKLIPEEHSEYRWVKRSELFNFIVEGNEVERWTLTHLLVS